MKINFFKYQATGNDFVILDNRKNEYDNIQEEQIRKICEKKFGVGADGLIMLNTKVGFDFEMKYYNADGKRGSLCGNGSRCLIKFYHHLGLHQKSYKFLASDGEHEATISDDGIVSLKMKDVVALASYHGDFIVNTGSPHYIKLVTKLESLNVYEKGRAIRYSKEFEHHGINVNFVEELEESELISVRTYERGVENETLSCGTGVTAAALVCYHNEAGFNEVKVKTLGGLLTVEYERIDDGFYKNIWLCGPAEKVFEGSISV